MMINKLTCWGIWNFSVAVKNVYLAIKIFWFLKTKMEFCFLEAIKDLIFYETNFSMDFKSHLDGIVQQNEQLVEPQAKG